MQHLGAVARSDAIVSEIGVYSNGVALSQADGRLGLPTGTSASTVQTGQPRAEEAARRGSDPA